MPSENLVGDSRQRSTSVSVVIPARNEAVRLRTLFAELDLRGLDVVVVDDESTDATAAVAAAAGARVISVRAEPGWTGKAWACWSGAQVASGDVIVLLDADTAPRRSAVDALAERAGRGGLVSVQPTHRTVRAYEQLSAIPNLVAVMGAGTGAVPRRTWWRGPAAFGMAIAVRKADYLCAGGHSAAPNAVADDLALARTMHAAGFPVSTWCGGLDISVRMYGEGVAQLARGWVKNLSAGARSIPALRTAAVTLWMGALVKASAGVFDVAVGTGSAERWLAAVVYVAFAGQVAILARRIGTFARGALLALPVLVLAFLVFFTVSAAGSVVGRHVSWRGRSTRIGAVS
jgi:hypothetical protein